LKCLITKYSIFLQVIYVVFFANGGSVTNAQVYQGSMMAKRLKSTDLVNTRTVAACMCMSHLTFWVNI